MARAPLPPSPPSTSAWRRWWQRWWPAATTSAPSAGKAAPPPRHDERRPEDRRSTRSARREQLYAVVRENMIRAGVLSGSYKFKVLTLDPDGASHLVLIDIESAALQGVPEGALGLEQQLQLLAAQRLQLEVRAVYWRLLGATLAHTAPARSAQTASGAADRRGFEPTRPMARQEGGRFAPLSETQLGDLD